MMTKIEIQAMDAVIGIHREMKKANEVDWEQRRYEIAKDVYSALGRELTQPELPQNPARLSVEMADLLIAELKRSTL